MVSMKSDQKKWGISLTKTVISSWLKLTLPAEELLRFEAI